MAGNTIYMQEGSNYIDIHDNEVVNLNIDKATVSMSDGRCRTEDEESKAEVLTGNAGFMAIMQKAEEQGLCVKEGWQYKWREKIDAVYFASVASHKYHLSNRHDRDGELAFSWKPFEALFDGKGFRSIYNDYQNGKYKLVNKNKIDKLFR